MIKKPFILKALNTAVLSTLGLACLTTGANAVHINPNGLGQALIYPYYTVRSNQGNAYDTYISVVNSAFATKAVRVRIREGKNGRSVADFNLYLAGLDTWTGVITATPSGAKLSTRDRSCTIPAFPPEGIDFSNEGFSGDFNDNETGNLDRTREGFMEVIEMGEFRGQLILEINKGNCAAITDSAALLAIAPGAGGLYGSGTLINVLNGVDYSYAAVALDGFSAGSLWQTAPSPRPDLSDVNPKTSYILNQGFYGTTTVTSNWQGSANPADPVSAVLMRDTIINEFVLDSQTASGTDWVVTMPTKHYYVGLDPLVGGARSNSPAQRPFQRNFGAGGACDDWNIYTRGRDLSTLTPDGLPNAPLCWAANVISFNNSKVLASSNGYNFQTVHTNGSAILDFRRSILHTFSAPGGVVYSGLPAVGFMVQDFVNGTIRASDGGRVLSNYGGLFEHKYTSKSFLPSP